ncbi:hypothetical protein, partial [Candidatus Hakubella thermalkaliphila]|uniref:hypothetical protein n=1 Tax=Candidatus Hakubella thermalkaliphila TaxID=2754717 RepID=UPI001C616329
MGDGLINSPHLVDGIKMKEVAHLEDRTLPDTDCTGAFQPAVSDKQKHVGLWPAIGIIKAANLRTGVQKLRFNRKWHPVKNNNTVYQV